MKHLFKNAMLTDDTGSYQKDLLIENNLIRRIDNSISDDEAKIHYCDGLIVMPSFTDTHVHFRDPGFTYKEDLCTGSLAAVKGGYTCVNAMANTKPICDHPAVYEDIMKRAKKIDILDYHQIVALTKGLNGQELIDLSAFSTNIDFLSDDGKDLLSNDMMYQAMLYAQQHNIGLMIHAEEPTISPYDYRTAEDLITIRDLYLAKRTRARIHFCHVSTIDAIRAIRTAKKDGVNVSCEVTPHHLYFHDTDYKVNPPIRSKDDCTALIQAIQDGTVDCIATDHAPHSQEDKEKGAPGMIGLETSFSVCYTTLVKEGHISLSELSRIMSYNPAKILNTRPTRFEENAYANLVVVDTNHPYTVDESMFHSRSRNSPYIGHTLYGKVLMTLYQGRIVYDSNKHLL